MVSSKFDDRVIVDFNIPEFKGNYDSREISDKHAFALYHNNVAMEALTNGDTESSFRYLKKSILLDSDIAGPWINLGVLYSRHDLPAFALAAYQRGLEIDPDNRSALTNLAHLYRSLGNTRMANRFSKKIRAYQKRNPYFHYYRARLAFNNNNFDEAFHSLNRAIRLKETEHQFHFLKGVINYKLGHQEDSLENFVRARELAGFESTQQKYDQKIALLAAAQR
jgi:Flp pilus assembly protein TadD